MKEWYMQLKWELAIKFQQCKLEVFYSAVIAAAGAKLTMAFVTAHNQYFPARLWESNLQLNTSRLKFQSSDVHLT